MLALRSLWQTLLTVLPIVTRVVGGEGGEGAKKLDLTSHLDKLGPCASGHVN